ncbi:Nucleolar protein 12 [Cryptosporidium felis]|nr:Nucleolar protein 12 [Cryptosporidium felis]
MQRKGKSRPLLTKHGRKGTVITFSVKKKDTFVNGFRKRKQERREIEAEKKKLKEKQFRDGVKRDAKEAMKRHIESIKKAYDSGEAQVPERDSEAKRTAEENSRVSGSGPAPSPPTQGRDPPKQPRLTRLLRPPLKRSLGTREKGPIRESSTRGACPVRSGSRIPCKKGSRGPWSEERTPGPSGPH